MKYIKWKKILILFLFFICVIAYKVICKFDSSDMELNGLMIFSTPMEKNGNALGICLYDLENENYKTFLDNYSVMEVCMNLEKNKILFTDLYKIYEYDLNEDSIKIIYGYGPEIGYVKYYEYIRQPSYIPNSSYICFTIHENLFIYDTEAEKCIKSLKVGLGDYYDCYKDGKTIVYSYNGGIFKYNFDDNSSYYMFDGEDPVLSANDQYIVYRKSNEKNVLVVRNLITNEIIERKCKLLWDYTFSPTNDKIAFTQEKSINSKELVIWDFKTNKTKVLIELAPRIHSLDWK